MSVRQICKGLLAPCISVLLFLPNSSAAGGPILMEVPGIPGEASSGPYNSLIECYIVGSSVEVVENTGGGGTVIRRPAVEDLRCVKTVDIASVPLLAAMVYQTLFSEIKLYFLTDDISDSLLREVELRDVILSGFSTAASGSAQNPTETISMNFTRIKWTHFGDDGSSMSTCFDIRDNQSC